MEEVLDGVSDEWKDLMDLDHLKKIHTKIAKEAVPPPKLWFEFMRYTDVAKIRVIIIGMDPYYDGSAHGLCFSCLAEKTPASLRNIYKALAASELILPPTTNDLRPWARNGVLLMNAALSTCFGVAGAHPIWHDFTETLLKNLAKTFQRKVYVLLWGADARDLGRECFSGNDQIVMMTYGHPSPRAPTNFAKCDHFQKVFDAIGLDWSLCAVSRDFRTKTGLDSGKRNAICFTDGACRGNGKKNAKGAYAVCFTHGVFNNTEIYGALANATNIRAEAEALIQAMKFLRKKKKHFDCAYIMTDSQFWIDMLTSYIPKWLKKGDSFDDHANPDTCKKIYKYWKKLSKRREMHIIHVPAHDKKGWSKFKEGTYEKFCFDYNDYVDQLATYALENDSPFTIECE